MNEKLRNVLRSEKILNIFLIVGLFILFYYTSHEGVFLSTGNINTLLTQASELGIIVIGVALLMISGEFDLSVGSLLGLSGLLTVLLFMAGMSPFIGLGVALIVGLSIGLINSQITTRFGIPSFIATLGMMMMLRGVILFMTEGRTLSFRVAERSPIFYNLFAGEFFGWIPVQLIWFLAITGIFAYILDHHRFGNHIYATGGQKDIARALGINPTKVKIICFIIVGVLAALSGVMRATRIQGFHAGMGRGLELMAIAATVIGGTSLFGGKGTIIGAFLGPIIITSIQQGIVMSRVSGYLFDVILGLLIIIIVIVYTVTRGRDEASSSFI